MLLRVRTPLRARLSLDVDARWTLAIDAYKKWPGPPHCVAAPPVTFTRQPRCRLGTRGGEGGAAPRVHGVAPPWNRQGKEAWPSEPRLMVPARAGGANAQSTARQTAANTISGRGSGHGGNRATAFYRHPQSPTQSYRQCQLGIGGNFSFTDKQARFDGTLARVKTSMAASRVACSEMFRPAWFAPSSSPLASLAPAQP